MIEFLRGSIFSVKVLTEPANEPDATKPTSRWRASSNAKTVSLSRLQQAPEQDDCDASPPVPRLASTTSGAKIALFAHPIFCRLGDAATENSTFGILPLARMMDTISDEQSRCQE
jgi:hypothetical protein